MYMQKKKLMEKRIQKGMTQEDVAILSNMDQTTYGRKEKGTSKITGCEWKKFASVLDVPLKEIFEDDDKIDLDDETCSNGILKTSSSKDEFSENYNVPQYILKSLKNYIEKLEKENKFLEKQIELLKSQS